MLKLVKSLRVRLAFYFAVGVGVALFIFALSSAFQAARLVESAEKAASLETISALGEAMWTLKLRLLLQAALWTVFCAVLALLLMKHFLRPLMNLSEEARKITAQNPSQRLTERGTGDEIDHLAQSFNQTFDRLTNAIETIRQVTADMAHELKTPLTVIRSECELALTKGTPENLRESLSSALEEVEHLTRIVNDLNFLAKCDAGQIRPKAENFDLREMLAEITDHLSILALDKGLTLSFDAPSEIKEFPFTGDQGQIRRLFLNLVENGVKYTEKGSVRVYLRRISNAGYLIEVTDTGMGICDADQARVFDRLFRVDRARSRDAGGSGLGLAIAKEIIRAHGGELNLVSALGKGSTFQARLPFKRP